MKFAIDKGCRKFCILSRKEYNVTTCKKILKSFGDFKNVFY